MLDFRKSDHICVYSNLRGCYGMEAKCSIRCTVSGGVVHWRVVRGVAAKGICVSLLCSCFVFDLVVLRS